MLQLGLRPKLYFNRDVQVEYGIKRDHTLLDFYRQLNLDYHLGLNNFLQIEDDHRDTWRDEYYTYHRQPLHSTPERINTPQLELNLPQLTFAQLKQKYCQFWEAGSNYFSGGETRAIFTLDSFLKSRFHGYHTEGVSSLASTAGRYVSFIPSSSFRHHLYSLRLSTHQS